MTLHVYGLKNCDSCRAAMKALDMAGIGFDFHDVRGDGVPAAALHRVLDDHGADRVVNRRSTTWRELDAAARAGDSSDLLAAHPALMKRPLILLADGTTTVGWDDSVRTVLGLI